MLCLDWCGIQTGYHSSSTLSTHKTDVHYALRFSGQHSFIDSQGNVCPCDFTMLSFGNILERPIQEIWEETSKHFCIPGQSCYANISNDVIFSKKKAQWPLKKQATLEILED